MRNPVQTYRGELACRYCYERAKGDTVVCPIDHEPIEISEIFDDKHQRKEILQLHCRCVNRKHDCDWQGTVGEIEEHERGCEYGPVRCTLCNDEVRKQDVSAHLEACYVSRMKGRCMYAGCSYEITSTTDLHDHL